VCLLLCTCRDRRDSVTESAWPLTVPHTGPWRPTFAARYAAEVQYPSFVLAAVLSIASAASPLRSSVIAADGVKRLSDAEIRKRIIVESIESYPGNCPCPYNTASNGSRCGRRSAYDREGGEAPLCYPRDVSDEMVAEYRERLGE